MTVKPNPDARYLKPDAGGGDLYPRTYVTWWRSAGYSIRYAVTQRDARARPCIYIRRQRV